VPAIRSWRRLGDSQNVTNPTAAAIAAMANDQA
jgi:hypothetical protein